MLTLDIKKTKDFFFDRLKVIEQVDKDQLRFLRNAGGFARRTARNSMKRRGKARTPPKNMNGRAYQKWLLEVEKQPASPAGTPPFTHTDSAVTTLKNILFAFGGKDSVIVGPVGLNGSKGSIPALHEYGGTAHIPEKQVTFQRGGSKWVPRGRRVRPGQQTRKRSAKYPARPFMAPAVAKTQSKFKNLWFASESSGRAAG
jgi:hypothetical protein